MILTLPNPELHPVQGENVLLDVGNTIATVMKG